MKYYIYGLLHPETNELRYIGKTKDIKRRYSSHFWPKLLKVNTHKNHWIKSLLKINLKPKIKILAETNQFNIDKLEKYYITLYKNKGVKLTNGTPGGDGQPLGYKVKHSNKFKKAIKNKRRKVITLNLETNKILKFNSIRNCAKYFNEYPETISMYLQGFNSTTKNLKYYKRKYIISYLENYNKITDSKEINWILAINILNFKMKLYKSSWDTKKDGFDSSAVIKVCKGKKLIHKNYHFLRL